MSNPRSVSVSDHRGRIVDIRFIGVGRGQSERPPILLIHGLGSSLREWRYFLPWFAYNEKGEVDRRVIAVTLPGCGDSSALVSGGYRLQDQIPDILAGFLTTIGIDPGQQIDVVANSLGTAVATCFANRCPDRVRRMVQFSPQVPIGPEWKPPLMIRTIADQTTKKRPSPSVIQYLKNHFILRQFVLRGETETPYRWSDVKDFAAPCLQSSERTLLLEQAEGWYMRGLIAFLKGEIKINADRLPPILAVFADEDEVPNAATVRSMRESFVFLPKKGHKTRDVSGGHAYAYAYPRAAADIAKGFLDR